MKVSLDLNEVLPTIVRENPKRMLEVTAVGGKPTVRINSSSLAIILACPRKSYYALHRGLRGKSESPALTFGTAIHAALEVFYSAAPKTRTIPRGFNEASDMMAFGHPAPSDHFLYKAIEAFVQKAEPLKMMPETDRHSIPTGVWILQEYFKSFIQDPWTCLQDANGPVAERTCEATLYEDDELRIDLFGTIDLIMKNEVNGAIMAADHKTTSIIGKDFFARLKPNHQYTGYIFLAQQCLGLESDEFMVNALQKKEKPKTARGMGPHFARQVTRRTAEDINELRDSVHWAVSAYLSWSGHDKWPLGHVNECASYGGCQFLEVCSAPNALRENIIQSKFVTVGDDSDASAQ